MKLSCLPSQSPMTTIRRHKSCNSSSKRQDVRQDEDCLIYLIVSAKWVNCSSDNQRVYHLYLTHRVLGAKPPSEKFGIIL